MTVERIKHYIICDDAADYNVRKGQIESALQPLNGFTQENDEPSLTVIITQPDRET